MRIFEFHFNPKGEKDLIFDSFCYEPATNYEKRMGSLYMTGLLGNILPKQKRFLDNLAENIKENYYKTTANKPGKSLRETLKKANIFLENISKTGDVSWLGNLSFAALSLKSLELNFTKVGDFKIILLRKGQVIDIDQKLKFEGIEPYPLKVFGNIVSGKLAENDVLLVLTKEIFDFLKSRKTLHILAQLAIPTPSKDNPKESIDPQKIKDFFNEKKESFFKIPGLALLILLTKNQTPKERETLTEKRSFSLKKAFSFPIFNNLKRRVVSFKSQKVTIKKTSPGLTLPKKPRPSILKLKAPKLTIPRLNFPKFNLPRINLPKIEIKRSNPLKVFREKKVVLILTLFFLLILGYFVFEGRKQEQMKEYQEEINLIAEKVNQAETFLIVAKTNPQAEIKANSLFQESWQDLSPILNIASTFPQDLANQTLTLKETISSHLLELSKLEIIEEPELVFEFSPRDFIPHKIINFNNNLYLYSPYSENVFEINQEEQGKLISINQKFDLATLLDDSILFFKKPDLLRNFENNQFNQTFNILPPYSEYKFTFTDLDVYKSNLYFLDKDNSRILKYPYLNNFNWGPPQSWLSAAATENATDFKSMAVSGSVWVLTKDNEVKEYFTGRLRETLEIDIFPEPREISKIISANQLLYLLEPIQKRVVILKETGEIVKQLQAEDFNNLLDFSLSEDGKTLWLLNGLKVYRLSI